MHSGNFLIYDDDMISCEELKKYILKLTNYVNILTATQRDDAERIIKCDISVLFVDIELENNNDGIEFAKAVRNSFPNIKIIFVTAYIKYCEEIFSVCPSGFIVKPFSIEKVKRAFDNLKNEFLKDCKDYLVINNHKRILLNDIMYIENMNRKLVFYNHTNEEIHTISEKISVVEKQLPDYFVRCHYSILVNLYFINDIKRYYFICSSGKYIPISQSRFKNSKERFIRFLGNSI